MENIADNYAKYGDILQGCISCSILSPIRNKNECVQIPKTKATTPVGGSCFLGMG